MLSKLLLFAASLLLACGLGAQVGSVIGQLDTPTGENPVGLGSDQAGNLYLTTVSGMVYQMTQSGQVVTSWSVLANTGVPNGITTDGVNFFVTDASAATGGPEVDVYDLQGAYVRSFSLAGFTFPSGIVWSPTNNHLYVNDRVATQCVEMDLQGVPIATFTPADVQNDGIGYDLASNSFWVHSGGTDLATNYDASFTSLSSFTSTNGSIGSPGRGATFIGGVFFVVGQSARKIVMFDTTGTSAGLETYGNGCPRRGMFYEQFTGAGTSDLSGRSFIWRARGTSGWNANIGGTFITNFGPNLNSADDQIFRAQPLGFSWTVPGSSGGSTTAIDISSNGWVGLTPNDIPDTGFYVGATPDKLQLYPRICTWWDDLDPAAGGSLHYTQNSSRAVVTWDQVPQFGMTDSNTIQLQLWANGDFVLIWQAGCVDDAIVGFSSGSVPNDPGSIDYTAILPFYFGPYGAPLTLGCDRPRINTNVTYMVSNIPSNAILGGILFGTAQTAIALDPFGAPGCSLLTNGDLATGTINLTNGTFQFSIPNNPGLIGANMFHQAALIAPGSNNLGVVSSNGLKFLIGT